MALNFNLLNLQVPQQMKPIAIPMGNQRQQPNQLTNAIQGLARIFAQNKQPDPNAPIPQAGAPTDMSSNPSTAPMTQDVKDAFSMENIVRSAQAAYPNNPNMAKLAAAQAIHESGLGSGKPSKLAQQFNLFGIKGAGTAGSVVMPTTEYINGSARRIPQGFATNKSIDDSFKQHMMLLSRPRYQAVNQAGTFEDAARAVQQAGYATDPKYAQHLINVYNTRLASYFDNNNANTALGPNSPVLPRRLP